MSTRKWLTLCGVALLAGLGALTWCEPREPTARAAPAASVDFAVASFRAPDAHAEPSAITRTIWITVTNAGDAGFNRAPVGSHTAQSGQLAFPPGAPRAIPSTLRVVADIPWVWVDGYVDPVTPPTLPQHLGNCLTASGLVNYAYVYGLGIGETTVVALDCWLASGQPIFYTQVDTCDSATWCALARGYVLEPDEANNIGGPATSGVLWQIFKFYFPVIRKDTR